MTQSERQARELIKGVDPEKLEALATQAQAFMEKFFADIHNGQQLSITSRFEQKKGEKIA